MHSICTYIVVFILFTVCHLLYCPFPTKLGCLYVFLPLHVQEGQCKTPQSSCIFFPCKSTLVVIGSAEGPYAGHPDVSELGRTRETGIHPFSFIHSFHPPPVINLGWLEKPLRLSVSDSFYLIVLWLSHQWKGYFWRCCLVITVHSCDDDNGIIAPSAVRGAHLGSNSFVFFQINICLNQSGVSDGQSLHFWDDSIGSIEPGKLNKSHKIFERKTNTIWTRFWRGVCFYAQCLLKW